MVETGAPLLHGASARCRGRPSRRELIRLSREVSRKVREYDLDDVVGIRVVESFERAIEKTNPA